MPASNMSVQPAAIDSEGRIRPSMKQDLHPEHNMPSSEHDGTELPTDAQRSEGMKKLKSLMKSDLAPNMMNMDRISSEATSYLARGN